MKYTRLSPFNNLKYLKASPLHRDTRIDRIYEDASMIQPLYCRSNTRALFNAYALRTSLFAPFYKIDSGATTKRILAMHQPEWSGRLDTMLLRLRQIPVNDSVLSVPLLQPLISLLEVSTVEPPTRSTQWTRMYSLQDQMFSTIDLCTPLLRWRAPS